MAEETKLKMPVSKIRCIDDRPEKAGMPMIAPETALFHTLREGIRKRGLLTPIAINKRNMVVFGHYRFLACRELGWKEVEIEYAETVQDLGLSVKSGA